MSPCNGRRGLIVIPDNKEGKLGIRGYLVQAPLHIGQMQREDIGGCNRTLGPLSLLTLGRISFAMDGNKNTARKKKVAL